jgi:cyclomaltodextrinase / maltogenic alpha-amylase / neopullulanase
VPTPHYPHRAGRALVRSLAALLLVLAGCGGSPSVESSHPRSSESPLLAFDQHGGDVWSFERRVTGQASAAVCRSVVVERGEVQLVAELRGARFEALVPLREGENEIAARCVDREGRTRARATRVDRVRLEERPLARLSLTPSSEGLLVDTRATEPTRPTGDPVTARRFIGSGPAQLVTTRGRALEEERGDRVVLVRPEVDGEYAITLEVSDAAGRRDRTEVLFEVSGGVVSVHDLTATPAWLDMAVIYGVVPFLFGERAFEAVQARLPELVSLGVDTLWITPVQETPGGDFGYEVLDHFRVSDELGGEAAFRELVDAAHAHGLRVIFDFVPNHTSRSHEYFADAEANGARSPYFGSYERDARGAPVHYFDWEHLPSLALDEPEVRRMLIEAAVSWVERFDLDGMRVDVGWGIEERAPGLLSAMRDAIRRVKPDTIVLAEASARNPPRGVDAAYDWTEDVGRWAWSKVFDQGRVDLEALKRALRETPVTDGLRVFRFLDNNDTGIRFQVANGRDTYLVATTLLFTLPWVPGLFTGDETGFDFHPYQRETPLPQVSDPALVAHFRRLSALRRSEPALTRGSLTVLDAEPRECVLAIRRDAPGAPSVVVAASFCESAAVARISGATDLGQDLHDRLERGPAPKLRGGALEVALPARSARVLSSEAARAP